MFDPPDEDLMREIEESERLRDDCLKGVNNIIREYVGRHYRGSRDWEQVQGNPEGDSFPEPFSYSFVSNMLPALVSENPSVAVKARRVIGHKLIQEAMQSGLKSWIDDIEYKNELERVVLDFLFFQGVLMHFIEDDRRWADGAVRPNIIRIDYRKFGIDSLSDHVDHAQFMFHKYAVDLDDLQSDPAVIPEALAMLRPNSEADFITGRAKEPFRKGDPTLLKRRQATIYSIWLREKNVIRVMAKEPRALKIYEERPYYGPYCGPYTVFQAYPVPGQVYPLSPLVAVHDQVRDLQLHARATSRSAAGRKTVILVDGTNQSLPEDIANAEDREVIAVPGFSSSQAQQLELGGVSTQQYQYLEYLRARLDRHSGMTETARGNVGGADSATEAQIASESLNNRTEYLKAKVRDATAKSLHAIGWFLFNTPGIIIPVSNRDSTTGMETEALFFGGPQEGIDAGSWEDYDIKIEPLSMQRVSEQVIQRRAMDFAGYLLQVAPLMPQMPYIRWMEVIRMVGESMNQDNVDNFIIPEMLGMFSQPPMANPSMAMGGPQQNPDRYSIPGPGYKQSAGQKGGPMQDRMAGFGAQYGDIGGGMQGPPGSAQE